jgi:hypothetical protein
MLSFAVPPGSFWVVRAQRPGYRAVDRAVRVAPGRFEHRIALRLERLRDPGRLRIRMRGPGGAPIRYFYVTLAPARTGIPLPDFDRRHFSPEREISGLTPGRYRLTVKPESRLLRTEADRRERAALLPVSREIELRAGLNRITLDAEPGSRLGIRIRRPEGRSRTALTGGCRTEILGRSGPRSVRGRFYEIAANGVLLHRRELAEGRLWVLGHRFRPGPKRIRFQFDGYDPAEVFVPFEAGRLHEVELRLRPSPDSDPAPPNAPIRSR